MCDKSILQLAFIGLFLSSCRQVSIQEKEPFPKDLLIRNEDFGLSPIDSGVSEILHGENFIYSEILAKIRRVNQIQFESVGIIGAIGENYLNFKNLEKTSNIPQLVALTDDSNAVLACYAGLALIEKDFDNLPIMFEKFYREKREVEVVSGCIISTSSIPAVFYDYFYERKAKSSLGNNAIMGKFNEIMEN